MMYTRSMCAAPVLAGLVLLTTVPALAQAEQDAVPLIMLKPQDAAFSAPRLRKLYAAIKKRAGESTRQILTLTKTEMWSVPKEKSKP